VPVTEPDINNRLESLCLSMTEHALGGTCSTLVQFKNTADKIYIYICNDNYTAIHTFWVSKLSLYYYFCFVFLGRKLIL